MSAESKMTESKRGVMPRGVYGVRASDERKNEGIGAEEEAGEGTEGTKGQKGRLFFSPASASAPPFSASPTSPSLCAFLFSLSCAYLSFLLMCFVAAWFFVFVFGVLTIF